MIEHPLGICPRESWGRLIPNFLRNYHIDCSKCLCKFIIPPAMEEWSVLLALHPCQHEQSLVFLILAILTGVRWNIRVILTCISLMAQVVEHLLKYFLAIWDSSVENPLFRSVPQFLIGLFGLHMSSCLSSLYILYIKIICLGLYPIFKLKYLGFWCIDWKFLSYKSFTSFVRVISRYFILFVTIVK